MGVLVGCTVLAFILLGAAVQCEATGLIDSPPGTSDSDLKVQLVGKYSIYRKKSSWGDAQTYCEHHEGHLATFIDIQDVKDVIEKIYDMSEKVTNEYLSGAHTAEFGLDRRYWIGLTDAVTGEGNWVWAGMGKPLNYHAMWYPGQPDHYDKQGKYIGRPEHCVALWNPVFHKGDRKHTFADIECSHQYYFICEKDEEKIKAQKAYQNKNPGKTSVPSGRGINMRKHPSGQPGQTGRGIAQTGQRSSRTERARGRSAAGSQGTEAKSSRSGSSRNRSRQKPKPLGRTVVGVKSNAAEQRRRSGGRSPGEAAAPEADNSWKSLPGFSELFEPSQSSSIEEKNNYIEVDKTAVKDETNEIFD